MPAALRSSGIPSMDEVPWGSHLCLFYETQDDLIDSASRYFAPGLDSGELCVWALPDHVSLATAQHRLRDTVDGFDEHLATGRLRLIDRDDWHGGDESVDAARVAEFWAALIDDALDRGFDGMRASGDAFWLANRPRDEVLRYEHEIARLLAGKPVLALCTYDLTASRGIDVLDIARLHHLTVARRRGDWQPFETPPARETDDLGTLDDALSVLVAAFPGQDLLTERERVVLSLLVKGASSKEVARGLGISPRTADFHRANIIEKLGARNTADVIRRVLGGS
jgi:DNA-binding CsgD family transcriptional regulator